MNRTPLPPVFWLVVRDHGPELGFGSHDIIDNRDLAYDTFSDAAESGDPVAVWQIAMSGGLPCGIKDVTDAFERELQDVCIARDLDWPTVRRIEDAPVMMAAE